MHTRYIAVGAVVVFGLVGCSGQAPPSRLPAGAIPSGTAQVSVNGQTADEITDVACQSVGSLTSIAIGNGKRGVDLLVDNATGLIPLSVAIRHAGFTGSYLHDLQGDATVTMSDQTYAVTGMAVGFGDDEPHVRSERPFTIKAAC
jgi:ipoprotein LpqH